jgi:hypothetical protein
MTELEARSLQVGDIVACRRRGTIGRFLEVTQVLDRDFTPDLAIQFLRCAPEVANRLAFDGPVIFTYDKASNHKEIWSPPHIHFPIICYDVDCEICHSRYELHLPYKGFKLYRRGMRPSSSCLPDEPQAVTTFLDSKICRCCNPYYHSFLLEAP